MDIKEEINKVAKSLQSYFPRTSAAKLVDVERDLYKLNTKGVESFSDSQKRNLLKTLNQNLKNAQEEFDDITANVPRYSFGKRQGLLKNLIFEYKGALKKLNKR